MTIRPCRSGGVEVAVGVAVVDQRLERRDVRPGRARRVQASTRCCDVGLREQLGELLVVDDARVGSSRSSTSTSCGPAKAVLR